MSGNLDTERKMLTKKTMPNHVRVSKCVDARGEENQAREHTNGITGAHSYRGIVPSYDLQAYH